jgi:hypothetical protein
MLVNSFHFSAFNPCGISIFSRHLCEELSRLGHDVLDTNLHTATSFTPTPVEILHYAPSSFESPEASHALITFLNSREESQKLFVILHGLYNYEEDRLLNDALCPNQAEHIRLMLQTADSLTALSESVARACNIWRAMFRGRARILKLDHPGLFIPTARPATTHGSYAFIGGISRPKKNHAGGTIPALLDLCQHRGIRVWEHWTNLQPSSPVPKAWKQTCGILSDVEWGDLISHAQVVLCPYQTRIQSVSGLIAEALSAHRFVLSTSFEIAIEMNARLSTLVLIENNIQRWPDLIRNLPQSGKCIVTGIPTWNSFARSIVSEFSTSELKGLTLALS